jgi:hypothetical protein
MVSSAAPGAGHFKRSLLRQAHYSCSTSDIGAYHLFGPMVICAYARRAAHFCLGLANVALLQLTAKSQELFFRTEYLHP